MFSREAEDSLQPYDLVEGLDVCNLHIVCGKQLTFQLDHQFPKKIQDVQTTINGKSKKMLLRWLQYFGSRRSVSG